MIDIKKLKDVDLLQGLRVHEIDEVVKLCDEVKFAKGSVVFREGEKAEFFYILIQGKVDLRFEFPFKDTSKEMTIASVPKNGSFGWSAILEPYDFTLSALCLEDCRLIKIHGQKFRDLCERLPDMGVYAMENLVRLVNQRLTAHQDHIKKEVGEYLITKW